MAGLTKWLNKLVKTLSFLPLVFLSFLLKAQEETISLEKAFQLAEQNYPMLRQKDLIKQFERLSTENLNTSFLPQINLSGQATTQSDVTKVPFFLPGGPAIPFLSTDQYRAIGEVNELIYDGGITKGQKKIQELNSSVEENKLAVELYHLKLRISQLYFSILYQDGLLDQTDILLKDVQIGIDKTKPQVDNGLGLRSSLQVLQAQLLQVEQRAIEIKSARKGLAGALSILINRPISDITELRVPAEQSDMDTTLLRPELHLYQSQSQLIAGQRQLIHARNLPKANVFFQGGYGRPGLDMLSNEFQAFYIAGIRLNWSLGSLYNSKREKQLLDLNRQTVDLQKEVFVLDTHSQLAQEKSDIDKYAQLVATDEGIIQLRKQVTDAAKAQLENGVITATDYLIQVNAEDQARLGLVLHQLQLHQAQINFAITTGKL